MPDVVADQTDMRSAGGEAAWKADCGAVDRRNAAAKRAAREHQAVRAARVSDRERRLEQLEAAALEALNKRMGDARP